VQKKNSTFFKQEIFGPVLPLIPFHSIDEVISMDHKQGTGHGANLHEGGTGWIPDLNPVETLRQTTGRPGT
ncbi:MAG: aldehyde dehydrogenase family protein, partial [Planctomycetota bacterium]